MDEKMTKVLAQFPFLTLGTLGDTTYLGIIQNCDSQLISMYVLGLIPTVELRRQFLDLGYKWWWDSNRKLPINIFLKDQFRPFREYLKHFSRKDFTIESGPAVSLQDTISSRVRKRQITLVRTLPPTN